MKFRGGLCPSCRSSTDDQAAVPLADVPAVFVQSVLNGGTENADTIGGVLATASNDHEGTRGGGGFLLQDIAADLDSFCHSRAMQVNGTPVLL